MSSQEINLPYGYSFVTKESIKPHEIIELRVAAGWSGDTEENWQTCLDQPAGIIVGVQDSDNRLIGMGRITADARHAVLCDLAVAPENRQLGIGKAILLERVRMADEKQIPYLYTELADDNPLKETYVALGFTSTGNGLFRNSRSLIK